jgi:SpoVK/Ycf46/Vps4 family AAA+-type ATPase
MFSIYPCMHLRFACCFLTALYFVHGFVPVFFHISSSSHQSENDPHGSLIVQQRVELFVDTFARLSRRANSVSPSDPIAPHTLAGFNGMVATLRGEGAEAAGQADSGSGIGIDNGACSGGWVAPAGGGVCLIGTVRDAAALDAALRLPPLFSATYAIAAPNAVARVDVLQCLLRARGFESLAEAAEAEAAEAGAAQAEAVVSSNRDGFGSDSAVSSSYSTGSTAIVLKSSSANSGTGVGSSASASTASAPASASPFRYDFDVEELAVACEGYSGRDLSMLLDRIAHAAVARVTSSRRLVYASATAADRGQSQAPLALPSLPALHALHAPVSELSATALALVDAPTTLLPNIGTRSASPTTRIRNDDNEREEDRVTSSNRMDHSRLSTSRSVDSHSVTIRQCDVVAARAGFVPSALRDIPLQASATTWADIGGLHAVRATLRETLEMPTRYAEGSETKMPKAQNTQSGFCISLFFSYVARPVASSIDSFII